MRIAHVVYNNDYENYERFPNTGILVNFLIFRVIVNLARMER